MTSTDYSVEVFGHPQEFPNDVIKLLSRSDSDKVETDQYWYENFVDTVSRHLGESRFYVLRRNSRPVVILPLLVTTKGHSYASFRSLSNYYTSYYSPVLDSSAATEDLTVLFNTIRAQNKRLYSIRIEPLDSMETSTSVLLASLKDCGFLCFKYFCFANLTLVVKSSFEDYRSSLGRRVLNTLRRKKRKLDKENGTLEIVSVGQKLEQAMSEYQQVYKASWKHPEPFSDFIPGLVQTYSKLGWIRIGVARLKDRAIAAQIWIIKNGRASIFKLAYDEEYRQYSAGTLLTELMLRNAIEIDNVRYVDYMKGDDSHKKDWMNSSSERVGIVAYDPRTLIGLALIAVELVGKLYRFFSRYRNQLFAQNAK